MVAFYYDTSVDIRFDIRTEPEAEPEYESFTVDVRLHLDGSYSPGVPARIHYDEYDHPAEGPDIELSLERVEIRTNPKADEFRPAVGACYPDANDQAVIDAAEELVDERPDGLIEALIEECCPEPEWCE